MSLTANAVCRSYPPPSGDNILYSKHVVRWYGHVACIKTNVYIILMDKSVGKNPLGINKTRWENNIKMRFKEIECKDVSG
jgi:hypothetical protein